MSRIARRVLLWLAAVPFLLPAAAMAAEGRISGSVQDESGNPVAGARVTVTSRASSTFSMDATTDERGRFEVAVPNASGTYLLRVEREGLMPSLVEATGGGNGSNVTVTLHPPATPPPRKADPAISAYNDGVELLQKGDRDGAEKKFLAAIAARPDMSVALRILSQIAYDKKDYPHALEYGRKALAADPESKDLYGILMDAASRAGDAVAAADYKKKYVEANAANPDVVYNAAVESYTAKDYATAAEGFGRALELKPSLGEAAFWLAMSEYNLKKLNSSRTHFQKYLELAPQGPNAGNAKDMLAALRTR
jgi:TolA-binding protein